MGKSSADLKFKIPVRAGSSPLRGSSPPPLFPSTVVRGDTVTALSEGSLSWGCASPHLPGSWSTFVPGRPALLATESWTWYAPDRPAWPSAQVTLHHTWPLWAPCRACCWSTRPHPRTSGGEALCSVASSSWHEGCLLVTSALDISLNHLLHPQHQACGDSVVSCKGCAGTGLGVLLQANLSTSLSLCSC